MSPQQPELTYLDSLPDSLSHSASLLQNNSSPGFLQVAQASWLLALALALALAFTSFGIVETEVTEVLMRCLLQRLSFLTQ